MSKELAKQDTKRVAYFAYYSCCADQIKCVLARVHLASVIEDILWLQAIGSFWVIKWWELVTLDVLKSYFIKRFYTMKGTKK